MSSYQARIFGLFVLTVSLSLSPFAFAETSSSSMEGEQATITVTTKDKMTFESDVSRMSGQVSINQSDLDISYDFKAFEKLPVSVWFDYKHLDINENLPVDLPARLEGRTLGVGVKFPVPFTTAEGHYMGVDVMPSWYTDDWTWTSSAFRVPFRMYYIYKPADNFVFVAGATIKPGYDNVVVPVIGFNYQPNDRWDIHLASTEPTISYKLTDNFSLFGEYDASLDEYEVTRAGQKGVVFKYRQGALGGGVKFHLEKRLEASISGGVDMGRRLAFRDNLGKVDADAAPYVKVRFSYQF